MGESRKWLRLRLRVDEISIIFNLKNVLSYPRWPKTSILCRAHTRSIDRGWMEELGGVAQEHWLKGNFPGSQSRGRKAEQSKERRFLSPRRVGILGTHRSTLRKLRMFGCGSTNADNHVCIELEFNSYYKLDEGLSLSPLLFPACSVLTLSHVLLPAPPGTLV